MLALKNSTYLLLEKRFLAINVLNCGHFGVLQCLAPAQQTRECETAVAIDPGALTTLLHSQANYQMERRIKLLPECKSRSLFVFYVAFD